MTNNGNEILSVGETIKKLRGVGFGGYRHFIIVSINRNEDWTVEDIVLNQKGNGKVPITDGIDERDVYKYIGDDRTFDKIGEAISCCYEPTVGNHKAMILVDSQGLGAGLLDLLENKYNYHRVRNQGGLPTQSVFDKRNQFSNLAKGNSKFNIIEVMN